MSLNAGTKKKGIQSGLIEFGKIIVQALIIAFVVRWFFFQPFNIPSGSMKPTLLIGDYLFVSKLSYGYSRHSFPFAENFISGRAFAGLPKRGDVVVFKKPDTDLDYIKRVIGLPGDTIVVRNGIVFINDVEVKRVRDGYFVTRDNGSIPIRVPRYRETLPNGVSYPVLDIVDNATLDNVGPYHVPEGHYFMMGDNRDNSSDSRERSGVGDVPYENLIGRAEIIFFSAEIEENGGFDWTAPWTWPFIIRWSRFFTLVR